MLDGHKPHPYERRPGETFLINAAISFSFLDPMTITSERMAGKKPNPVDTHVGSRVRLRRMLLGMSQERLGDSMGLTFQQVQKYEKGVNRIGASRLFHISKILDVPVQFFF